METWKRADSETHRQKPVHKREASLPPVQD